MNLQLIDQASSIVEYFAAYHRHRVVGLQNVPEKGRCLLVVNHSLATYDIALLTTAIYKKKKRVTRSLMDRWFFKFPMVSKLMSSVGAVQGEPDAARKLLLEDQLVCVAPGGMREAIRPSTERYQIIWKRRKGFAKLAIETQSPVVLAACPKADDIFEIYPTKVSMWFYEKFKLPVTFLRGLGPTPIPKPVQLVHFVSEPLIPPVLKEGEEPTQKQVDQFHAKLTKEMKSLMGKALTYRHDEDDLEKLSD